MLLFFLLIVLLGLHLIDPRLRNCTWSRVICPFLCFLLCWDLLSVLFFSWCIFSEVGLLLSLIMHSLIMIMTHSYWRT